MHKIPINNFWLFLKILVVRPASKGAAIIFKPAEEDVSGLLRPFVNSNRSAAPPKMNNLYMVWCSFMYIGAIWS